MIRLIILIYALLYTTSLTDSWGSNVILDNIQEFVGGKNYIGVNLKMRNIDNPL